MLYNAVNLDWWIQFEKSSSSAAPWLVFNVFHRVWTFPWSLLFSLCCRLLGQMSLVVTHTRVSVGLERAGRGSTAWRVSEGFKTGPLGGITCGGQKRKERGSWMRWSAMKVEEGGNEWVRGVFGEHVSSWCPPAMLQALDLNCGHHSLKGSG